MVHMKNFLWFQYMNMKLHYNEGKFWILGQFYTNHKFLFVFIFLLRIDVSIIASGNEPKILILIRSKLHFEILDLLLHYYILLGIR